MSGAENGAGRKSGERERSGERRSQKMMEREERGARSGELRSGNGAESGLNRALKDHSEVDPTMALSSPYAGNHKFEF